MSTQSYCILPYHFFPHTYQCRSITVTHNQNIHDSNICCRNFSTFTLSIHPFSFVHFLGSWSEPFLTLFRTSNSPMFLCNIVFPTDAPIISLASHFTPIASSFLPSLPSRQLLPSTGTPLVKVALAGSRWSLVRYAFLPSCHFLSHTGALALD